MPKIDGEAVSLPECVTYKGMLLSGVPNFAIAVGYTASSWTLKIGKNTAFGFPAMQPTSGKCHAFRK